MFVFHPKLLFRSQSPLTTLPAAYEKVIETLISRQFRKFIMFILYGEVGLHLPTFHKYKFLRLSKASSITWQNGREFYLRLLSISYIFVFKPDGPCDGASVAGKN